MPKVSAAKRVQNMIDGLEELEAEYSGPAFEGLVADIRKAIQALERVRKSLVG